MKLGIRAILISICTLLCLAGCAGEEPSASLPPSYSLDVITRPTPTEGETPEPPASFTPGVVDAEVLAALTPDDIQPLVATTEADKASQAIAQGANTFAFDLTKKLLDESKSDNFICSPYSVWMSLAALSNAADKADRPALLKAMGAGNAKPEAVNKAASRMLYDLTGESDRLQMEENQQQAGEEGMPEHHNPLTISNAVFLSTAHTPDSAFVETYLDSYRGTLFKTDFASPEAAKNIDTWVRNATQGKLGGFASEYPADTVASLLNAIYYSDNWSAQFPKTASKEGAFHGTKEDAMVTFMHMNAALIPYYENDEMQAVNLRFSRGGLFVLLPKDQDAAKLLSGFTQAKLRSLTGAESRLGNLALPRFALEGAPLTLGDTLQAMGVSLFEANKNKLPGLTESKDPVWVSSALHKAVIEADEEGVTAAAVTEMITDAAAPLPEGQPFDMVCDRPFAFILYGDTIDAGAQVLFTGVVNQL